MANHFQKNWNDSLSLASKLSGRKIRNWIRLMSSYHLSNFSKKAYHSGFPISLAIEPTTACNLRCPECPSGLRSFTRPTGMLQSQLFQKIINELHPYLLYLTFYFQGEPYLHPDFTNLVRYASDKKIYTATSTNAHFLTKKNAEKTIQSGLDRLIISIDGTTQEVYQNYRIGGKLEKVLEGTKNIVEAKKAFKSAKPHLIFQFLVVRPNEHQIEEAKQLTQKYQVNEIKFKTAQIYDYKNGSPLIPTLGRYSRYRQTKNGTFVIKNDFPNECLRMWTSCVITWDGKVVPCCFDKDAQHEFGNLEKQNFQEIWQNSAYQNFRNQILKARSQIEICRNCTEGSKVFI